MGASTFMTRARGRNAGEAFSVAVSNAKHNHGHGGYTGTIAEKNRFILIDVPKGADPRKLAQQLLDDDDPRILDKYGPAGCVLMGNGEYLFFGWASS